MKRPFKRVLFTIVGMVGIGAALEASAESLTTIDQLPVEIRAEIVDRITEKLMQDPSLLQDPNSVLAIDVKGTVYEIHKTLAGIDIGAPSCAGGGSD
jgi:hypothetical protein